MKHDLGFADDVPSVVCSSRVGARENIWALIARGFLNLRIAMCIISLLRALLSTDILQLVRHLRLLYHPDLRLYDTCEGERLAIDFLRFGLVYDKHQKCTHERC